MVGQRRIRVLQISPHFSAGGAERCARELFERLPDYGIDAEVWVARRHAHDPDCVKQIRYPAERLLYPLNFVPGVHDWRHIGSQRHLDAIRPQDYDVVHLHNLHGNWISIKAVARLCRRMPVVWTLHDEWAATPGLNYDLTRVMSIEQAKQLEAGIGQRSSGARLLARLRPSACYVSPALRPLQQFLRRHMPQPATIISPSRYILDLTRSSGRFPNSRFEHIPNGLTLLEDTAVRLDRAEARRRFQIPPTAPVILLVAANLDSPYKGMSLAVRALRLLRESPNAMSPAPHVLLLGRDSGPLLAELSAGFQVHTAFARDNETLAAAYRAATVTLLPSVADNLPYVALESFACSRPLVAFRIGGLEEIVGQNERGLLAAPFDVDSLAAHVRRLLVNPCEAEDYGRAGFEWVSNECRFPEYATRIARLYEAVGSRLSNLAHS